MKIAIVVSSLDAGGTERFSTLLAGGLLAHDHTVCLITLAARSHDFFAIPDGVVRIALVADLLQYGGPLGKLIRYARSLKRLRTALRSAAPDLIVALGWSTNVIALAASTFLQIPVVISERTDPREHQVGRFWYALQRVTYPMARRLVVQTPDVGTAMTSWVRRGRISIIPNPVLPAALAVHAEPGEIPLVVAMGRMTEEKGFDVLVRAFAQLADRRPLVRLRIIGDGPLRASLTSLAHDLGVADRVELTGILQDPHAAMQSAWCACLSSRFEGFPNALLESMAMGLPIVATDCRTGPAELLRGGAGLLIAVDDVTAMASAIERIIDDRELAQQLGRRAAARAREFGLEPIVAAWHALVEGLGGSTAKDMSVGTPNV